MSFSGSVQPADRPDYADLPPVLPTERQLAYAFQIASSTGTSLPGAVQSDRGALSEWIAANSGRVQRARPSSDDRPSSRQVDYAEKIARGRRRLIPDECYRSRALLSRWIDSNRW